MALVQCHPGYPPARPLGQRIPRSCPRRLPGAQRMTIAVGVLSRNGVVIAADTEETYGDFKLDNQKILGSVHISRVAGDAHRMCLLAGSGLGPYIDAFAQSLDTVVAKDGRLQGGDPHPALSQALERFYARHVIPFSQYQTAERPSFEVILAYSSQGRQSLFESHMNTLLDRSKPRYSAIGIGSTVARLCLQRLLANGRVMSLREAVIAAAFAVLQAKETIPGCGKGTDIRVLYGRDAMASVVPPVQEALDAALRRYIGGLEPLVFGAIAGTWSTTRVEPAVTRLRDELNEILEPEWLPAPTPSAQGLQSPTVKPDRKAPRRGRKSRKPSQA